MDFFHKYFGFFLIEFHRTKFYFGDIFVRILMIVLRLALPYSVFFVLAKNNQITFSTATAMLWAILMGQILNGSNFKLHEKIRDDIRSGNISIRLSEPVNYVLAKLFQCFGFFIPTFLILSLIFLPFFIVFFPTNLNLFILIAFSFLSCLIISLIGVIVGLTSFIFEENDGIFYITQKLFLIFGNFIIPVALMPFSVYNIAKFTPFFLAFASPIEAASGRFDIFLGFFLYIFYILFLFFISQWMLSSLQKKVILNG